ncbi:MAG: alpha/beta hydrolase [Alphaproteobacteria bacterium]|nr:alpha/beta hydrolase [Alphaproteobacteria bacterium]
MFEGFQHRRVPVAEGEINLVIGGSGPPLLLLHGYPQTHVMWHKVAPVLTQSFTVVCADLRGYGDSFKPAGGPDHAGYAKRAMARDQVEVMQALGFRHFGVAGHDRGGRVAHRLALDHGERVAKLAVLDICPTHSMYAGTDKEFATAYYHWFFLIQKAPLPEKLIGADPAWWINSKLGHWGRDDAAITPEARAEYIRCFSDPAAIHGSCEDYRAAATIDLAHDAADLGRKLAMPVLALWGAKGFVGRRYDVVAEWRRRAEDVRGWPVGSGHFLPEEAPGETADALLAFFRQ